MLLGLGTWVLPNALVERLVLASGLVSLVPALAPPLAVAMRVLLSISAAIAGALLGYGLGRCVAFTRADSRFPEERARRPLLAREELGDIPDWTEPEQRELDFEGSGTLPENLALDELVERLRRAVESREWPVVPDPPPASDMDAALRSAMERLRQLRGVA